MLRGLRTVACQVGDLEAARDWYTELLGYGPYFDQPFYVGFEVGGYELGLQPAGDDGRPGSDGPLAYWAVDDLGRAMDRLEVLGARVRQAPVDVGGGIQVAAVVDPFGNALGVIQNPEFRAEVGARVAATGATLSERTLVHEARVPAPPSEVWALWTSSEGFARWLLPQSRVELRVGGAFELYFDAEAEPGSRGGEGNRVLAFLPERLLTFTWNAPPHLKTREARTWVVLELTPDGEGTQVRLTHAGWPAEGLEDEGSDWPQTFAYFERAWGMVVGALCRHLGGAEPDA